LRGRIVRFFNCYGPRMEIGDGRLIPNLIEAGLEGKPFPVHGDGEQTRSLTYVDDAIEATLAVADSPETILSPVNVGRDDERSVLEIVELVAKAVRVPVVLKHLPPRPQDPRRRRPILSRVEGLGWKAQTSLDIGVASTVRWFQTSAKMVV
jgi:dTDP-glucose 4,6-dehydratase